MMKQREVVRVMIRRDLKKIERRFHTGKVILTIDEKHDWTRTSLYGEYESSMLVPALYRLRARTDLDFWFALGHGALYHVTP